MRSIQSMTGFGRAEAANDDYRLLIEIKSVNHRYLDLSLKMPRRFNCFESRIRQFLKSYFERGKTDIYITYEDYTGASRKLVYNRALAEEYYGYINEIASDFDLRNDLSAAAFARFPDIFTMEEVSDGDDRLWDIIEPVLKKAAESFVSEREREGENLKNDLLSKLDQMDRWVDEIIRMSPSIVDEYRSRLYDKVKEALSDLKVSVDEARIISEVTIYSDKICTDEEMVRLKSHIDAMMTKLKAGGSCGRELDFIAQEMNREANTTLSKANNLKKADIAIALKTEVEKVREQVQNIE